jgi:hypothetical protein
MRLSNGLVPRPAFHAREEAPEVRVHPPITRGGCVELYHRLLTQVVRQPGETLRRCLSMNPLETEVVQEGPHIFAFPVSRGACPVHMSRASRTRTSAGRGGIAAEGIR